MSVKSEHTYVQVFLAAAARRHRCATVAQPPLNSVTTCTVRPLTSTKAVACHKWRAQRTILKKTYIFVYSAHRYTSN